MLSSIGCCTRTLGGKRADTLFGDGPSVLYESMAEDGRGERSAAPEDLKRGGISRQCCGVRCTGPRLCCCLCSGVLMVLPLAVLLWFLPTAPAVLVSYAACGVGLVASAVGCSEQFRHDIALAPVGVNGVPLGYFTPGLRIGISPRHFNQTAVTDWDSVHDLGSQLSKRSWSGEWWRGNELGYVVNNPAFWANTGVQPATIVLGSTTGQHAAVRPYLEKMFALTEEAQVWLRKSARGFLDARKLAGKLGVPGDVRAWVHQVLHRVAFGEAVEWEAALRFVQLQDEVIKKSTFSQALPAELYSIMGIKRLERDISSYVEVYEKLVIDRWGEELAKLDCAPTPRCSLQLAAAAWDALNAAGGLSVPNGIQAGLGVLFSRSSSKPRAEVDVAPGTEPQFFWECLRFFPPVYGVPYWTTRPTCQGQTALDTRGLNQTYGMTKPCPAQDASGRTGFPPTNQWQGGQRVVLDVGRAQHDPGRWGDDAGDFKLRPMADYEANSVGFAEMARDPEVAGGLNDRSCPARALALAVGATFFEVFERTEWTVSDPNAIEMDSFDPFTQVSGFDLRFAGGVPEKP